MKTEDRITELVAAATQAVGAAGDPVLSAIAEVLVVNRGRTVKQAELATAPEFQSAYKGTAGWDKRLRICREGVRRLRVKFGFPVAAGQDGYFIPENQGQIDAFVLKVEKEAKARARSSFETYKALRETFRLPPQSDFLETLGATETLLNENRALRAKLSKWGRPPEAVRKMKLAEAAKQNLLFPGDYANVSHGR